MSTEILSTSTWPLHSKINRCKVGKIGRKLDIGGRVVRMRKRRRGRKNEDESKEEEEEKNK